MLTMPAAPALFPVLAVPAVLAVQRVSANVIHTRLCHSEKTVRLTTRLLMAWCHTLHQNRGSPNLRGSASSLPLS